MQIENITAFEYCSKPMGDFPIRHCTMIIYAHNKDEADAIFHSHAHQYFEQDLTLMVREIAEGYRQIKQGGM